MAIGSGLQRKQRKNRGLVIVLVIVAVIGIVAGWRTFDFMKAVEKLKGYFSTAVVHFEPGEQVRGTIYDRTYKEMAVSLPRVSVFGRPREIPSIGETASSLAAILRVAESELVQKLQQDELRVWLAKDISDEQEEELRRTPLAGVYLHNEYSRYYPQKEVAAHLIGFAQDDIGLAGAEYYYDRLVQQMLGQDAGHDFAGGVGQHLLLTLDLKVQNILEKLVTQLSAGRENGRIGVYAMDSGTGALIASVQRPSFDPNRYRIYPEKILENLFVRPMLLPSLFRGMLRDAAAIQAQYEARGQVQPWSISTGDVSLGSELRLWERFGFSASVPEEFGNSGGQAIRATDYFVVAGQSTPTFGTVPESLSPMTLMTAFAMLTNGGTRVLPHLGLAVTDAAGEQELQLHQGQGRGREEVVAREVSREVSRMVATLGRPTKLGGVLLQDVIEVEIGTASGFAHLSNELYLAAVPGELSELVVLLTIQGGSREVAGRKEKKPADPAEELVGILPRIAVLQEVGKSIVGVAEPEGGETGNYPAHFDKARQVVRSSLARGEGELADPGNMPDLSGLSLRKSLRLLQHAPCRIVIFGTGRAVSQTPAPGKPLVGVEECVIRLQNQEEVSLEALEEKGSERK